MKKLIASLVFTAVIGFTATGFAGVLTLDGFGGLGLTDETSPITSGIVAPLTYNGSTVGSATYNRPNANGTSAPTTNSATATAVPFDMITFTVATTGTYNFLSTSTTAGFNNFTVLYSGSSPLLANALIANDDITPGVTTTSGFNYVLTAGSTYAFVTTGSTNASAGSYSDAITLSAVPEPGMWAMMGAGLIGLVSVQRLRRRSA